METAKSWEDVPRVIDERPAEMQITAHGISRSLSGRELGIDFGDGDISMVVITFKDPMKANAAYCKGIRLDVKVVKHPEHS